MTKKVTALMPMKGHSERVPNKNMKLFAGKPLYHAVATSLLESAYIDELVINTDSEAIIEDCNKNFPEIRTINRPEEIRGDFVSMNNIIEYDLAQCGGEHFLQTHSTNPLLKTSTIDAAIEKYFDSLEKYDSLFAVTKFQTRFYTGDGSPVNHNPEELIRTQDLPPLFEENSNFYIFSKNSFRGNKNRRIGKNPGMFSMDKLEAIDIDEPADFILAEILYMNREKLGI
jgi:CMP-N-acetylneuraminic acid synthetase